MAHIYINEVIGDDRQPYLILHGNDAEITARKVMGMIENSFNSSWEYNPKLRGKVRKPTERDVTLEQVHVWLTQCRKGQIRIQPVHRITAPDGTCVAMWYLSYAPDMLKEPNGQSLNDRISKLCEISVEMHDVADTRECYLSIPEDYEDKDAWLEALELEYQTLYTETIKIYGERR